LGKRKIRTRNAKEIMKNALVAAVALCAASSASFAGTMSYVGEIVPNSGVIEIVLPAYSFSGTGSEGRFLFNGQPIDVFCIEVTSGSQLPATFTAFNLATSDPTYRLFNSLFTQFYPSQRLDPIGTSAIQAVIWEIVEDTNNLNLNNGVFRLGAGTDAAVALRAQQMLTATIANSYSPTWAFTQYRSDSSQDLMGGTPLTIPLPGSLGMLAVGALAWLSRSILKAKA
jgi:hypothetical protein